MAEFICQRVYNNRWVTLVRDLTTNSFQFSLVFVTVPSQGRDNEDLAAGTHTYPFSFQLPVGVPASFEHPVGRVRYRVQGIVDVLWQFDIKTKTPITVTKALDLNLWPDMMVGCGFVC